LRDGAGIFLTETVTGIGVLVGTGVTVVVTVGELVAVLIIVDNNGGLGVWVEGWFVPLPCKVKLQAKRKEIIIR